MDINDLGNIIISSVKSYIDTKYRAEGNSYEDHYCACDEFGNPVFINIFRFGASIIYKFPKLAINYQFLKDVGEILTYYKFEARDDGALNIMQGRTVRGNDGLFVLMVNGAIVRYSRSDIAPENIISWPFVYYGISFEDTLNLLKRNGEIEAETVEPEFAEGIKAEDIHFEMELLADKVCNKLNVEPSR